MVHLAEDLKAVLEAGDLEAARVVHETIGRLIGSLPVEGAAVVAPATERARRDGRDRR